MKFRGASGASRVREGGQSDSGQCGQSDRGMEYPSCIRWAQRVPSDLDRCKTMYPSFAMNVTHQVWFPLLIVVERIHVGASASCMQLARKNSYASMTCVPSFADKFLPANWLLVQFSFIRYILLLASGGWRLLLDPASKYLEGVSVYIFIFLLPGILTTLWSRVDNLVCKP